MGIAPSFSFMHSAMTITDSGPISLFPPLSLQQSAVSVRRRSVNWSSSSSSHAPPALWVSSASSCRTPGGSTCHWKDRHRVRCPSWLLLRCDPGLYDRCWNCVSSYVAILCAHRGQQPATLVVLTQTRRPHLGTPRHPSYAIAPSDRSGSRSPWR